jgi:hypothetical protein
MSWPHDRLKVTQHITAELTAADTTTVTAANLYYALLQLVAASAHLYVDCIQVLST